MLLILTKLSDYWNPNVLIFTTTISYYNFFVRNIGISFNQMFVLESEEECNICDLMFIKLILQYNIQILHNIRIICEYLHTANFWAWLHSKVKIIKTDNGLKYYIGISKKYSVKLGTMHYYLEYIFIILYYFLWRKITRIRIFQNWSR